MKESYMVRWIDSLEKHLQVIENLDEDGNIIENTPAMNKTSAVVAFQEDSFSSGILYIKPGGIKIPERVEQFIQIFTISQGQPESLGVTIEGNKFILGHGDNFLVPANAKLCIENFSAVLKAKLLFVLLKV